ncbi:hypothetical protein BC830DRAFT_1163557 [Chytriomyces sp. MP71]|nr:hypothetical protein BC830DRAFT_1163557 [Chytriomyces sp. MP71]
MGSIQGLHGVFDHTRYNLFGWSPLVKAATGEDVRVWRRSSCELLHGSLGPANTSRATTPTPLSTARGINANSKCTNLKPSTLMHPEDPLLSTNEIGGIPTSRRRAGGECAHGGRLALPEHFVTGSLVSMACPYGWGFCLARGRWV